MTRGVAPKALLGLLTLAYPLLVYVGLTRWEARPLALLIVAVAVPLALLRARQVGPRSVILAVLPLAPAVILGSAAAFWGRGRLLLWVPALVNASLLVAFGSSLRAGATPVVERLARLREPNLPVRGVRHCRQVTVAWCLFFVLNGSVAAGLAAWASYDRWALYNGGIAYALMGLMFAGELAVRKWRMRAVDVEEAA